MLKGKNVYVTGARGFFGKHVCENLLKEGCNIIEYGSHMDLTDINVCLDIMSYHKPDQIIHLAGFNGGIQYNMDYPADIFYRNTVMGLNLHEAARITGVKKILSVVASCAWAEPDLHWEALKDSDILKGRPNNSVECHGYAKRNLYLASKFYKSQYNIDSNTICVTTLFGPGDTFDPKRTKVVGALIKKFVDAVKNGDKEVECWGDGTPSRQLIYVKDAAKQLVMLTGKDLNRPFPICLGSDWNFTIKRLAEYIAQLTGFTGNIVWNTDKPNGQSSKMLKTDRIFGLVKTTPFKTALEETINYYKGL
jgi:GDP-L-fucose synthase